MNWWTRFRGKNNNDDDDDHETQGSNGGDRKQQFNTTISPSLALSMKTLAAEYAVPVWVVAEHAMYAGALHLAIASQNRSKRDFLRKHLIRGHLLATNFQDSPDIARINEASYPSKLMQELRVLLKQANDYKEVLDMIASGKDTPESDGSKAVDERVPWQDNRHDHYGTRSAGAQGTPR